MNINIMVYIVIDNCAGNIQSAIKLVTSNAEEAIDFKNNNDEYNEWKILSFCL